MDTATLENKASHPWRLIFAGLCASLIANGFGRFAYTPGNSAAQAIAWGRCTAAFAIGQALAAYAYSAIFANFGDLYLTVFSVGGAGFMLAFSSISPSPRACGDIRKNGGRHEALLQQAFALCPQGARRGP